MIKWLARLFVVWVAIIFVASANEEILQGRQQLMEASNEDASATTTDHAAFPRVERESRTVDNALDTGKKARLQTDESDEDLLTIRLGTRGAYPSYSSSFGQSSKSGDISVLTENPIHLANNQEHVKFKSNDRWLFPSGASLKRVNSQASSSTARRGFLPDFDKTHETDASASTEHYIPSPTNPPHSLSGPFNLERKTQLQSDVPMTRGPLGNSAAHEEDGGRGTKRKMWNSWGKSLSLKNGITLEENDAQDSYATQDFLSSFPSEQPNRFSAEGNGIATPLAQLSPQEIQQPTQLFQLVSNTPYYHNSGASMAPVLSVGGRIHWEMGSMARQNGENHLLSLKPTEKRENEKGWGAYQGTKSSPISRPSHSLRSEKIILVDWSRSTEPLFNQSPIPQHNSFESGNQGSSSEDPEKIPQVSNMHKTHKPETINTVSNYPSQIDGMKKYGRLKFNTDLFMGEGPYKLERDYIVKMLDQIPRPSQGNFLLTIDQLVVACGHLRMKNSSLIPTPTMREVRIFMGNIDRWYQYWNLHAKINLDILRSGEKVVKCGFVFPLFLLYVEMIISIIPFKQGLPLGEELNYPREMRNAIESYMSLNMLMKKPPENAELKSWKEKQRAFKEIVYHARLSPSGIVWAFVESWMESHYTDVWNEVKENNGLHVLKDFKASFNTIFTHGIATLNEKLRYSLPHE